MCALIYQKTSEKTLILNPREGMQRAFDFGLWTEMRMGMYYSVIDAAGDNAAGPDETAVISVPGDYFTFGIKNSDTVDLPGVAGGRFVGVGTNATSCQKASTVIQQGGSVTLPVFGYEGVTLVAGSGAVDRAVFQSDPSPATNYCGFLGLRFVITNLGAATQSIAITNSVVGTTTGGTYPASLLLTDLNTFATPSTSRTVAWNNGAAAYTIPDAWFLRLPLYNNRIRVSCIRMKRYA